VANDVDKDSVLTYSSTTIAGFILNSDGSYSFDASDDAYQHLAKGAKESVTVTVTITDEHGATTSTDILFNLTGTNDTPSVEDITAQNLIEDAILITGRVSVTDVDDNAVVTYSTSVNISGFTLNSDGTYSFDAGDEAYQSLKKDEVKEITVAITATDEHGAVDSKDLVITLIGTNDTPTVEIIDASELLEDASVVTGQVVANDVDKDSVLTYSSTTIAGFILNSDGSYSFDASDDAYQHLASGAKESVTVTVTITDEYGANTTTNILFNLTGTNDMPIVEALTTIDVQEDDVVVNGAVVANDVDDNAVVSYSSSATIAGFTFNADGTYSFDAANEAYQSLSVGEVKNFIVPIVISDEQGAEVTKVLTLQITGTNDAPTVAIIQEQVILENELEKEGIISVSDVDNTSFTYAISTNVEHGTLTVDENGKWNYEVDRTYSGDDRAVITVTDSDGASVDKTIEFTINNNPVNGTDGRNRLRGTDEGDILNGFAGNDRLYAYDGDDRLYGDEGNDRLYGYEGNDKLYGGEGRDRLYGNRGNDELYGGTGRDYLKGGYGSDTYYFNIGDGEDTIKDRSKRRSSDVDKIVFGEGITQENLKVTKHGRDLILTLNDEDSLKIKYWFSSDRYKIEVVEFSDGSSISSTELNELITIEGTDRNDRLYGSNSMNDKMYGYAGNDRLYAYGGDDKLYGGEGNDKLYGKSGDDELYGGTGDDYLKGGYGSDRYYFEKGDGEDTIKDKSRRRSSDTDTILFGEDISTEDVSFNFDRRDLYIQYGESDEIRVKYQTRDKYAIEKVELADGNYLSSGDIDNLVQQLHAYADDNGLDIDNNRDIQNNQELMQIIQNAWHQ